MRLILCLPLMAVMAVWAFSYGRYNSWEFFLGNARCQLFSFDGELRVMLAAHAVAVPYWAIWFAMAAVTIFVHVRLRRPAAAGQK